MKAQKDIMKSNLSLTDADADKLAREPSKNKPLALCLENGKKHNKLHHLHLRLMLRQNQEVE